MMEKIACTPAGPAVVLAIALLSGVQPVSAAPEVSGALPVAATVAKMLGYTGAEVQKIQDGEIIFNRMEENSKKEVAITGAMLLKIPVPALYQGVRRGDAYKVDPTVLSRGILPDGPVTASDFERIKLDQQKIGQLADVQPGSVFNLSGSEIRSIRAAAVRGHGEVREAFLTALADRVNTYRRGGISAIAPYDRGKGKTSSPAEALLVATRGLTTLKELEPAIYRAFLNYPKDAVPELESEFSWSVHQIQGRPTVVLSQWMMGERQGESLVLIRQFYVEQSYNAQQIVVAALPVDKGTLVFYVNRTSSDQVDRIGSVAVHEVARRLIEKEVRSLFESIRSRAGK